MPTTTEPTSLADLPPPTPAPNAPAQSTTPPPLPLDPTRYGDWEKNGRCIDF